MAFIPAVFLLNTGASNEDIAHAIIMEELMYLNTSNDKFISKWVNNTCAILSAKLNVSSRNATDLLKAVYDSNKMSAPPLVPSDVNKAQFHMVETCEWMYEVAWEYMEKYLEEFIQNATYVDGEYGVKFVDKLIDELKDEDVVANSMALIDDVRIDTDAYDYLKGMHDNIVDIRRLSYVTAQAGDEDYKNDNAVKLLPVQLTNLLMAIELIKKTLERSFALHGD